MIELMTEQWRLFFLNRADRKTHKIYKNSIVDAKKQSASHADIDELMQEEQFVRQPISDEIRQIRTRRLCRVANRYDLPLPKDDDCWELSRAIGGRQLTAKGVSELRSAIRSEQNERWLYWETRLKVLAGLATALTGAVGALIGLAAILKK